MDNNPSLHVQTVYGFMYTLMLRHIPSRLGLLVFEGQIGWLDTIPDEILLETILRKNTEKIASASFVPTGVLPVISNFLDEQVSRFNFPVMVESLTDYYELLVYHNSPHTLRISPSSTFFRINHVSE